MVIFDLLWSSTTFRNDKRSSPSIQGLLTFLVRLSAQRHGVQDQAPSTVNELTSSFVLEASEKGWDVHFDQTRAIFLPLP